MSAFGELFLLSLRTGVRSAERCSITGLLVRRVLQVSSVCSRYSAAVRQYFGALCVLLLYGEGAGRGANAEIRRSCLSADAFAVMMSDRLCGAEADMLVPVSER